MDREVILGMDGRVLEGRKDVVVEQFEMVEVKMEVARWFWCFPSDHDSGTHFTFRISHFALGVGSVRFDLIREGGRSACIHRSSSPIIIVIAHTFIHLFTSYHSHT